MQRGKNCQGQSCKAFIGLTIGAKMIVGGRPLPRKILSQSDRLGAKFAFFHGIRQIFRPIISQWLKIDLYTVRKILSASCSLLLLGKTITHPAARSLCDS